MKTKMATERRTKNYRVTQKIQEIQKKKTIQKIQENYKNKVLYFKNYSPPDCNIQMKKIPLKRKILNFDFPAIRYLI